MLRKVVTEFGTTFTVLLLIWAAVNAGVGIEGAGHRKPDMVEQ